MNWEVLGTFALGVASTLLVLGIGGGLAWVDLKAEREAREKKKKRMQGRFQSTDELEPPFHFVDPDQINITDLAEFAESRGQGPRRIAPHE